MARIFKYELEEGTNHVTAPIMEVLDIQLQGGLPVMWALVNTDTNLRKTVDIKMLWTGQLIDGETMREYEYIRTLQDDQGLVWHVFIRGV